MNWVGSYQARVRSNVIGKTRKYFQTAEFFTLEDSYSVPASDLPTTEILYRSKDGEKKVKYYGSGPDRLKVLMEELEDLVDEIEWKRKVTDM
jgi:hypothetical protein